VCSPCPRLYVAVVIVPIFSALAFLMVEKSILWVHSLKYLGSVSNADGVLPVVSSNIKRKFYAKLNNVLF